MYYLPLNYQVGLQLMINFIIDLAVNHFHN